MKKIKCNGSIPQEIVFYQKTENNKHGIHIQLNMLKGAVILIYAYGTYDCHYTEWKWDSTKVELIQGVNIFREEPIDVESGEIKGHLLLNEKGEILDKNFYPIVLGLGIRLEEISSSKISLVLKEKMKITDNLPSFTKPLELYNYGDKTIENRIRDFLKEKSLVNKKIKIVDPYLSSDLIKLLFSVIPRDIKIEILTCQLGNKSDLATLQKELTKIPSEVNIVIKKLTEIGKSVNITKKAPPNPFHDRFIISDNDILVIGTSFNSIIKNSTFINEQFNFPIAEQKFDKWFAGHIIKYRGKDMKFEQYYP